MSKPFTGPIVAAGIAVSVVLVAFLAAAGRAAEDPQAAGAQKATAGPAPRTADGKVDFSGIWGPIGISSTTSMMR